MILARIFLIFYMGTLILADGDSSCKRPCPDLNLKCITKYFLSVRECTKPAGRVPDPYTRGQAETRLPSVNGTVVGFNPEVNGLNGNITEFCVNKKTNRAVLAVKFDLTWSSNDTQYSYWPPADEPVVVLTTVQEHYPSVLITTVFNAKTLDLATSTSNPFVDVLPSINPGPEFYSAKDPGFQKMVKEILANFPIIVREAIFTLAPLFAGIFVQYTLCDYGIEDWH